MDELFLEWPGGEQSMEIGTEELGDEVAVSTRVSVRCLFVATSGGRLRISTYISSRGEMKMSLREMILVLG